LLFRVERREQALSLRNVLFNPAKNFQKNLKKTLQYGNTSDNILEHFARVLTFLPVAIGWEVGMKPPEEKTNIWRKIKCQ